MTNFDCVYPVNCKNFQFFKNSTWRLVPSWQQEIASRVTSDSYTLVVEVWPYFHNQQVSGFDALGWCGPAREENENMPGPDAVCRGMPASRENIMVHCIAAHSNSVCPAFWGLWQPCDWVWHWLLLVRLLIVMIVPFSHFRDKVSFLPPNSNLVYFDNIIWPSVQSR